MRTSIWDILTGVVLLGILCLVLAFAAIGLNPQSSLNPFKPFRPTLVPVIVFPTPTVGANQMPPTWTPNPQPVDAGQPEPTQVDTLAPEPDLRPSSTPIPTNTVLVLPTFTATRNVGGSGVGGGSCSVVFQDPADDSIISSGKTFPVRWTIKNNSNKMWRRDSVDIRFLSGQSMHQGASAIDMPYDVGPNGMLDVTMNMTAPGTGGSYTTNWALMEGSISVCNFFLAIRVP
jgi:hypothetical protein